MLQVAKNLFTHLGELCDLFEQWRKHPPELFDLRANIDLYRLCPQDRMKDEATPGETSDWRRLSPESSEEEMVDSFTTQDEDDQDASGNKEEDEEDLSSPDSARKMERRKRRSAPYVIPNRSSPDDKRKTRQSRGVRKLQDEWFDASSEDISLGDIPVGNPPDDDDELPRIRGMPDEADDPWLQDFERGLREMERVIGPDDSDEFQAGDMEQDTLAALRAGQEELEGLIAGTLVRRSEEPSGDRYGQRDSDDEEFSEPSGVEDLTWERFPSEPRMRTRDSWGNVVYQQPPANTVTGATQEQSPTRPKSQTKFASRSQPFPTDSQCGRDLLRRQSSLVLQLDWSATTLSVYSIPNPPRAHLEDPCR